MLNIIDITNTGIVTPKEHLLLIEPFTTIWNRDKGKHKEKAIADFKYIEFMVSPLSSNPYKDLEDFEKSDIIIKEVLLNKYTPDILVKEAIDKYKEWLYNNSFSYNFYTSALKGANELMNFFRSVDLAERNRTGNPIYKPQDVTKALKDVEEIIKNLQGLEKRIFEEIKIKQIRGNKEVNIFEQ